MEPCQTLREIFEQLESSQTELLYNDYVTVIDALEWKHKDNTLTESFNTETDLIYYVEAVRNHNNTLNEWSYKDFSKAVSATKEKAKTLGDNALAIAATMIEKFKNAYSVTYDAFLALGVELQLGMNEIFNTLREKGIWEAVKVCKGVASSFISNLYTTYTSAYNETSDILFGGIEKTVIGNALKSGTFKIKDVLEKNPKLKYVVGPILAYTLYYIWTKMVFKGDFLYDFDWSVNIAAFMGDFDVVSIFSGNAGVELLVWFGLGLSGMFPSVAWLDGSLANMFGGWGNHSLAILATIMIYIHEKYPKLFERPLIKEIKYKLCKRDQKLSMKKQSFDTLKQLGIDKGIYKSCSGPTCAI